MLLILDSNEYIFALGILKKPACRQLLDAVMTSPPSFSIRIPRMIIREVKNNLTHEAFKEFLLTVMSLTTIDDDTCVPFELGSRYESLGFKPADAFIAAYTEWVGAKILVSENRHFLSRHTNLPFKVLTADKTLKLLNNN